VAGRRRRERTRGFLPWWLLGARLRNPELGVLFFNRCNSDFRHEVLWPEAGIVPVAVTTRARRARGAPFRDLRACGGRPYDEGAGPAGTGPSSYGPLARRGGYVRSTLLQATRTSRPGGPALNGGAGLIELLATQGVGRGGATKKAQSDRGASPAQSGV